MDSWDSKVQYQRRTGFCCSLGHVERWNPETPARNFNDLVEIIGLFPEQFLQDDGTLCTMLMIVGDNSKGPLNKEYQFCMGILFLEYNFDLVLRISYAAYKSYRDPAEAGNGAIGRLTNGYPHPGLHARSRWQQKDKFISGRTKNWHKWSSEISYNNPVVTYYC